MTRKISLQPTKSLLNRTRKREKICCFFCLSKEVTHEIPIPSVATQQWPSVFPPDAKLALCETCWSEKGEGMDMARLIMNYAQEVITIQQQRRKDDTF